MFTQKELNLWKRKWLELLKDYDMSLLYHLLKANVVTDSLSHMTMDNVSHVKEAKNDLVKYVHRLSQLGVQLKHSQKEGFKFCHNSESSLVVEVKSKQHLDPLLMDLKELVLGKVNESLSQGEWCC